MWLITGFPGEECIIIFCAVLPKTRLLQWPQLSRFYGHISVTGCVMYLRCSNDKLKGDIWVGCIHTCLAASMHRTLLWARHMSDLYNSWPEQWNFWLTLSPPLPVLHPCGLVRWKGLRWRWDGQASCHFGYTPNLSGSEQPRFWRKL